MKLTKLLTRLALTGAMMVAAFGLTTASAEDYDLYIFGEQVTSDNASDILGDGTLSYDADSKTLTIDGLNLVDYGEEDSYITFVDTTVDLNVNIASDSSIVYTSHYYSSFYGFDFEYCDLNITGAGVLTFESTNDCFYPIGGYGNVTIDSAEINIVGNETGINLYGDNSLVIKNSKIKISQNPEESVCCSGIIAEDIVIENSEVYIESYEYSAIRTGDVDILNSKVTLKSVECGIEAYEGNINIDSSIVNIESEYAGINADSGEVNIKSGKLHIVSENSPAVLAEKITIVEPNSVMLPEGGKVAKDEYGEFELIVPAGVEVAKEGDETTWAKEVTISAMYSVKWVGADEKVLEEDKVMYGTVPTYDGTEPVKAEDDKNTYKFKGWDKEVSAVTGDVTYTAVFEATAKATETPAEKPKDTAPKTGDATNVLALAGVSVLALAAAVVAGKRREN